MWYLHTDCTSKKRGSHRLPRLGQKNGFHDILKAQCHAVATAVLNHCNGSVHENVQGYDESHLKESCDHQFEMAVPLTWKTALFHDVPSFEVKPFFLTTIHISENPRLRCKVDASTVRKPDVKAQAIPSYVGWGAGMEIWTFPLIGSILNILNLFFYYASLFGYGILWALNPWYLGIGLFEKKSGHQLWKADLPVACSFQCDTPAQARMFCIARQEFDWIEEKGVATVSQHNVYFQVLLNELLFWKGGKHNIMISVVFGQVLFHPMIWFSNLYIYIYIYDYPLTTCYCNTFPCSSHCLLRVSGRWRTAWTGTWRNSPTSNTLICRNLWIVPAQLWGTAVYRA